MLTAKDLYDQIENMNSEKQKVIDSWLRDVVFKKFSRNGQGFEVSTTKLGMTLSEMKSMLELRGFVVTTHSDYQGSFVYISIPQQGK